MSKNAMFDPDTRIDYKTFTRKGKCLICGGSIDVGEVAVRFKSCLSQNKKKTICIGCVKALNKSISK